MGNNLRSLRMARGWTHEQAADAMGVSRSAYVKIERGERKLHTNTLNQAAEAFGVDINAIMASINDVPIVGLVGADSTGSILYISDGELGRAAMPPNGNEKTVAVRVRGDSMRGIADNNWLIYYDDVRSPLTEDMIGELCVLWLADGRVLVKKPFPSAQPNRYDLESSNDVTIRAQEIVRAAFVTALIPERFGSGKPNRPSY